MPPVIKMMEEVILHVAVFDENWFYVEKYMLNTGDSVKARKLYDRIAYQIKNLRKLSREVKYHELLELPKYEVRAKFKPPLYPCKQKDWVAKNGKKCSGECLRKQKEAESSSKADSSRETQQERAIENSLTKKDRQNPT